MIDLKIRIVKGNSLIELSISEFHRLQGLFEELTESVPENKDCNDEWGVDDF